MQTSIDLYIQNANQWQPVILKLQQMLKDHNLTETIKWKTPCYMYNKGNIVLIAKFKEYVALSFFKGVLIHNEYNLLLKPGEESQSVRMLKITSIQMLLQIENEVNYYIHKAIEIEKDGIKVTLKKPNELEFVLELQNKLNEIEAFKIAFLSLTPGRQRAYNIYFSQPVQTKTRETRIEKYIPLILAGKGINDCTCGLSNKMPYCDGSHKIRQNPN